MRAQLTMKGTISKRKRKEALALAKAEAKMRREIQAENGDNGGTAWAFEANKRQFVPHRHFYRNFGSLQADMYVAE